MKTSIAPTQFDQPNLTAAPATPSCCCCCCCCLATIVSTSVIAGASVNTEAKLTGSPQRTSAVLLAVSGQFVGFGLIALVLWMSLEWTFALLAGLPGVVVCWYTAFKLSGMRDDAAFRRASKYAAIFAAALTVEFFVGAVLVLMYVIPYVIVALFLGTWVTRYQLAKIRGQSVGGADSPYGEMPDAAFLMDAPPTDAPPTSRPRRSVADQPLPGSPKQ